MYRSIPLLIALSAATTNVAAFPSDKPMPSTRPNYRHSQSAAERRVRVIPVVRRRHREVVAMAPTDTEIGTWSGKEPEAGPASPIAQGVAPTKDSGGDLNLLGMLAAAVGLGGMSIVRRMGRL
ncbi:MAG: hypothetical protein JWN23_2604 [Rhodocyclales bacterium]|nr:hypothetical protein [Rhodocyclales bacterium]